MPEQRRPVIRPIKCPCGRELAPLALTAAAAAGPIVRRCTACGLEVQQR